MRQVEIDLVGVPVEVGCEESESFKQRLRAEVDEVTRAAKFPVLKSLETFAFRAIPSLNKRLVLELARSEYLDRRENLEALRGRDVPEQIGGLLNALRSEMTSVSRRVRVLDPLSVSGRQRKETFNVNTLIEDILSGHDLQFERHDVKLKGGRSCPRAREQKKRIRDIPGYTETGVSI